MPKLFCAAASAFWALSYFGTAFIHRAVRAVPNVAHWIQPQLVSCIAETGPTGIPFLVRLLGYPAPKCD